MLITQKFKSKSQPWRIQDIDSHSLDRFALESRVLIIEGISGSGKDTLQTYLRKRLKNRNVHDYSEGELLQSWNQLQISGIFKVRIKFMKLFVKYIKDTLSRDENAVFLLNRFHLSAYVMTISQQPRLEPEYDAIINVLRTLPVHIFILQLDESEIENRSLHPERSSAWQEFQRQIVAKEGFRGKVERYLWQQALLLKVAERQQLPYSVIQLPPSPGIAAGGVRVPESRSMHHRGVRINTNNTERTRRKRVLPRSGR